MGPSMIVDGDDVLDLGRRGPSLIASMGPSMIVDGDHKKRPKWMLALDQLQWGRR